MLSNLVRETGNLDLEVDSGNTELMKINDGSKKWENRGSKELCILGN